MVQSYTVFLYERGLYKKKYTMFLHERKTIVRSKGNM